jgi:hypothetical protein
MKAQISPAKPLLAYCEENAATVRMTEIFGARLEYFDVTDLSTLAIICNTWIGALSSRQIRPSTPLSQVYSWSDLGCFESDVAAESIDLVIGFIDEVIAQAGNDPWGDGVRLIFTLAVILPRYNAATMEVPLNL